MLFGWPGPCYQLGRTREGYELLRDLLPETHNTQRYLVEPYVLAGDVSMADGSWAGVAGVGTPALPAGITAPCRRNCWG